MSEEDLIDAIQKTVAYADIFSYPLTHEETHRYLIGMGATRSHIENIIPTIDTLAQTDHYITFKGRENIVHIRQQRESYAKKLWPIAVHYGQIIGGLPFVRMVALTGSLAVNNADAKADIDYMIVTAPDYLWLCRLFIVGVVKLAARQGVTLCPNYLISENALELAEQNLFTARELAQMVPIAGIETYHKLRQINTWTQDYLPNADGCPFSTPQTSTPSALGQKLGEAILGTPPGKWLDKWEMQRKIRKLTEQGGSLEEVDFTPDMCKGHFDAHQRRILREYTRRLDLYVTQDTSFTV